MLELGMVITEGNGGGRIVLIGWVSVHVKSDEQPEQQLVNHVNVLVFMLIGFFPSKIKHACSANVLQRLLKQNAFITKSETLDSFLA